MFSLKEIVRATGGALVTKSRGTRIKGISIDSRTVKKGELFIAIKGPYFDGHDFIKEVVKKSAAAIVISREDVGRGVHIPVILVTDTTTALGDIALFHRSRFRIPVVAITGSAGKTTTKDLVAAVLQRKYKVHKNVANHNNFIGVPLTLFGLNQSHEILVIELGTSFPGEINRLAEITRPTVAILTNIGEAHLEFLKTPANVFKEKIEIVRFMDRHGAVIFNHDDRYLRKIPTLKLKQKLISFSLETPSDLRARQIRLEHNTKMYFNINQKDQIVLPSCAFHMVYNALAALAVARLLGINFSEIKKACARFTTLTNRHTLSQVGPYWMIDDSYNSNPVSLRSAIRSFHEFTCRGRKIFVCGDMLELGQSSADLHGQMGRLMASSDIDILLTVGWYSQLTARAAQRNKRLKVHHCTSLSGVQNRLSKYLQPEDTIFIKGSRGIHLEKIVEFIKRKARV